MMTQWLYWLQINVVYHFLHQFKAGQNGPEIEPCGTPNDNDRSNNSNFIIYNWSQYRICNVIRFMWSIALQILNKVILNFYCWLTRKNYADLLVKAFERESSAVFNVQKILNTEKKN